MLKKIIILSGLLTATAAAAQSPPVGPPLPQTNLPVCTPSQSNAPCIAELGVFVLTNTIRNKAQERVDATNARLKAEGRSSRASIESLSQWRPHRSQTEMLNQPNSSLVRVPYILRIKVSIPATSDRHIGIPIDVNVFCDNWHTDNGSITVRSKPGPASFEGGNILEDVFNIGNYIDAQVRSGFSAPAPITMPIENTKCSTIGASDNGTETTNDDAVLWTVPRRFRFPDVVSTPTIEVTFDRLKRLPARSLGGGVLYQPVEDILLNTYANYSARQSGLTMREGDDVPLSLPMVRLDARKFDTLVVLGNIEQPPNNPKDSAFTATAKAANYGPGSHVLQIPKWYSRPPDRWNPKPTFFRVPAYELSYTVRYTDRGLAGVDAVITADQPTVVGPLRAPIPFRQLQ